MSESRFLWAIDAPEAEGLKVAAELGLREGIDFVREGNVFRFDKTEKAMLFNRSLAGEPNTGRAGPRTSP